MINDLTPQLDSPRRIRFDLIILTLFRPRRAFSEIAAQAGSVWLVPVLILLTLATVRVIADGPIRQETAFSAQATPPPGVEFSPEQQTQMEQTQGLATGPLFIYIFPTVGAVLSVVVVWLLESGVLHLVFTLLGWRHPWRMALNIVAWARLPYALRIVVRIGAAALTHQVVAHPGLSGFAPEGAGPLNIALAALLGFIDLYIIWHTILLVIGVRAADNLSGRKAWGGALFAVFVVTLLQALPGIVAAAVGAAFAGGR